MHKYTAYVARVLDNSKTGDLKEDENCYDDKYKAKQDVAS